MAVIRSKVPGCNTFELDVDASRGPKWPFPSASGWRLVRPGDGGAAAPADRASTRPEVAQEHKSSGYSREVP
jgi:hypothetical protein